MPIQTIMGIDVTNCFLTGYLIYVSKSIKYSHYDVIKELVYWKKEKTN